MFPIVTLFTDLTKFGVILVVLMLFLWSSGFWPHWHYLALPAVLLTQLLLNGAVALVLAAMVPYLPDLRLLVDNLLHLQFFLSGIFFAADAVPSEYRTIFYLNPMACLIEDYREILLYAAWPHWGRLGLIAAAATVAIAATSWFVHRNDRIYPRIVR